MGWLKDQVQKYKQAVPHFVRKDVLDDILGIETPMEAVEATGFAGLPLGPAGAKLEEEVGPLQTWEPYDAPQVTRGISVMPASVPVNGDNLDSWAWTENYLAGERAVAEAAKIQSKGQAEAMTKQAQGSAAPNGTIMLAIVPAIILLYFWTK